MNKVVARFAAGNMIKGTTTDFFSGTDVFHVSVLNASAEEKPIEIHTKHLKALFFVKDFRGDPHYINRNEFDPKHPTIGLKIRVEFKDGEVLVGTSTEYQPGRSGFFILPADTGTNNDLCYVVVEATKEIRIL
ncbi:MAG: hypothetical protein PHN75_01665 [Syntrophales bacterium]|nr:hypothetical protein [Syntrophales bacterium]